tara:strand:+ start:353 stop:1753 length:1401 start_codon:yes stop_codon:yes gene_type:complete
MTGSNTSNNKKGVEAAMAGNHVEAESFFRQAIKDNKTAIEGRMNLIRLLHMQGRHAETISIFKELETKAQLVQIHPQILYIATQSALDVRDHKMAIQNLQILAPQNPGNSDIQCMLSRALIESGRLLDSKNVLEKAMLANPDNPSIATQLAITESELGNYDKAENLHKKLTQQYSNAFLSHFNYGLFLVNIGEKERALSCFERCKQLVPNAPEAQEQIDKLLISEKDTLTDIYKDIEKEQWDKAEIKLRENQESIEPIQFWAAVNELPTELQGKLGEVVAFDEEVQVKTVELYSELERESFLNDLADTVKNTESLIWNRAGKPTRYGYQSHEMLNGIQSPNIQDLCKRLKLEVHDYIKDKPLLQQLRDQKEVNNVLSGWSVVLRKGGHQKRHIHPESVVSGVLYIQLPEESADEGKKEGNLLFPSNNMKMVTPKEGMLVLFPSYLPHQTIPIKSNDERICIAFNWT